MIAPNILETDNTAATAGVSGASAGISSLGSARVGERISTICTYVAFTYLIRGAGLLEPC